MSAGLTPTAVTINYSLGDDFEQVFDVSNLTLGSDALFIVRSALGASATTKLSCTVANTKAAINSGAGTVTVTETKANMASFFSTWGAYPFWLQVSDSAGKYWTVASGYLVVAEAHQS